MAARKLQADIDRVLKLVHQGVSNFEETFEKMTNATNQTSKDKAEADLKTSIKKLQRQRDQIKTWLQSNDIKDKTALMDHRKLIETQMERFKACEKEMKTKAFSKEGLSAQQKLDPKEAAKAEMSSWVSSMVDELSQQIERTEAEVETLRSQSKKKKAAQDGRAAELEALNDQRRWHITKLELIMRLLENGQISVDSVSDIKYDIQYYVESNTEQDFAGDDDLYEALNLAEEEDHFGMHDDLQSSHDTASNVEDSASIPSRPDTASHRRASKPSLAGYDAAVEKSPTKEKSARLPGARKLTLDSTTSRPAIAPLRSATVAAAAQASGPVSRPVPTTLPPLRYASAAAAAASSTAAAAPTANPANSLKSPPPVPPTPAPLAQAPAPAPPSPVKKVAATVSAVNSPEATKARVATRPTPAEPPAKPTVPVHTTPEEVDAPAPAAPQTSQPKANGSAASTMPPESIPSVNKVTEAPSPLPAATEPAVPSVSVAETSQPPAVPATPAPGAIQAPPPAAPTASPALSAPPPPAPATPIPSGYPQPRLPASLADLVDTFDLIKNRSSDLDTTRNLVAAGLPNAPQPTDAEKPGGYVPKFPYETARYYPTVPADWERRKDLWKNCDNDVLFYVFYYLPGGYMQYLAAKELKARAWRFHKQYLTWFQRADQPVEMTDDYEAGAYVYFDWEKHWAMRQKPHFTFEYKFLEDSF